jgi:hypothetical protein
MGILARVWMNNFSGQLSVTVPKNQDILDGDYVKIEKVIPPLTNDTCKICSRKYKDHTLKELHQHGFLK